MCTFYFLSLSLCVGLSRPPLSLSMVLKSDALIDIFMWINYLSVVITLTELTHFFCFGFQVCLFFTTFWSDILTISTNSELVRMDAFRIEALLSLSPPSALPSRPQPRQLSPGNNSRNRSRCGCRSVPASPRRELGPRLESSALLPAQIQPSSAGSSFLIRNILADCVYSEPGRAEAEAEEFQSRPGENTNVSSASSDSESRGEN